MDVYTLQKHHGVKISIDAILVAADGVRRFLPEVSRENILDWACEMVKEDLMNFAREFHEKEYELRQALLELTEIYRDKHPDSQLWVKRLTEERNSASIYIANLLRKWDFNDVALAEFASNISFNRSSTRSTVRNLLDDIQRKIIGCFNSVLTVRPSHVSKVISLLADVPITLILPSSDAEKKRAAYMTMQRVVNQEYAITEIFNTLASMGPVTSRPMGSFVLLGPSGVGKKEIAKSVARYWYCDPARLCEIDMSEYAEPRLQVNGTHADDLLRRLTEVMERHPYTVFLLRNIDKASSTVIEIILREVLSFGRNTVDFSKTIFFMTAEVGSRFQYSCTCYNNNRDLWEVFSRSPLEFYRNHECAVKGLDRERVLVEAREIIDNDLLESADKVLVMERIHNQKAVSRLMLRDVIREIYGQRTIVHASHAALDAIFLKARTDAGIHDLEGEKSLMIRDIIREIHGQRTNVHASRAALDAIFLKGRTDVGIHYLEGGTTLRQALLEHLIPKLTELVPKPLPGAEGHGNVSVCVDTLVGTNELSFRVQTHEQAVVDWYFKLPNGTFAEFVTNLRSKIEAISKVFSLRRQCIDLMHSDQSYSQNCSQVWKLVFEIRGVMLKVFSSPGPSIRLSENTFPSPSPSRRSALKEILSSKEKLRLNKCRRELKGRNATTGVDKATLAILDSVVKRGAPRYFIFEGMNEAATTMLSSCLEKSLGSSFTHVKLEVDTSGKKVRDTLIDQVRKRPFMVILIDRVEFADDVVYTSLLEIFDKGAMDDVDFQSSIVILASNVGNKRVIASLLFQYRSAALSGVVGNSDAVRRVRTELFYRVDRVMIFDPISPELGQVSSLSLTDPRSRIIFKGVFKE